MQNNIITCFVIILYLLVNLRLANQWLLYMLVAFQFSKISVIFMGISNALKYNEFTVTGTDFMICGDVSFSGILLQLLYSVVVVV